MFEKLEEKLTALRNSVKNEASNFAATLSLNSRIDDAKKKIAGLYGEVGEKFYTENKDSIPEGYEEKFEQIDGYFKEIDDCADQLKAMAGIRVCPGCGGDVAKGYRFCIVCGTKMPEEERKAANIKPVCEKCGVEAEEGAMFCINCGAKLPSVAVMKQERFCTRCGAKLVEGALFCTTCGEKIEQPQVEEEIPEIPEEEFAGPEEEPAVSGDDSVVSAEEPAASAEEAFDRIND